LNYLIFDLNSAIITLIKSPVVRSGLFYYFIILIFLLVSFIPGIMLYSQVRIARINYENTSGEKATTIFMYDPQGSLYRASWEMADKSRTSVNYYEHDKSGRVISTYRDFSNGVKSFEFFNYDSLDNKTAEFFYRSDTLSGYATYDYNGKKLIRAVCKHYKGWLDGEIHYKYDSLNRLKSASVENNKQSLGSITYNYDSAGNLSKEVWFMYGWWTQTFYYYYEPVACTNWALSNPLIKNTCNQRIISESYSYNYEPGGITKFYYDSKGNLVYDVFKGPDGQSLKTTFEHDEKGKIIFSNQAGSDGHKSVFKYTYDNSDRLILRICWESDSLIGFESYTYDTYGRLIRGYVKNYSDLKLTGYLSFSYDNFDRIEKGLFIGKNGLKADLFFTYDPDNTLKELLWNFYNGKFQKYIYEFKKS
jgi:hypothetical protein